MDDCRLSTVNHTPFYLFQDGGPEPPREVRREILVSLQNERLGVLGNPRGLQVSSQHQNREDVPSLMKIILDQTSVAPSDPEEQLRLDENLEREYRQTMY